MSSLYFFPQKVSVNLIQSSVLLYRASLHNKVIQITRCAIPKVSMFPKECYFLPFLFAGKFRMVRARLLLPVLGVTGPEKEAGVSVL